MPSSAERSVRPVEQAIRDDPAWIHEGRNVTELFTHYHDAIQSEVDVVKLLPLKSNIHELLALNHTLLLCPEQHSQAQIRVFGKDLLNQLHLSVSERHLNKSGKLTDDELLKIMDPITQQTIATTSPEDAQFALFAVSRGLSYSKQRVVRAIALW